ncbi:MAG TPA: pilus assembly protein TadG-related protein [Geminicoccaceae bacterium]|nr:pilus assembly protein TadG-related protein [Geminicoccus sp.]HMU53124.1 pilus assembly protein TadG-related protein [Geminicoccaceae bacterium]
MVAVITAMLVIPLVLAIGLAVDASRMFLVRAKLSQAVDAAALAAGQAVDLESVTADAQRIFAVNYPEAYMGAGVDEPEINYDEDTGQVEVIARTELPTMFMRLAHVDTLDLEARALVVREQTGLELALVLDTTGSMCDPCSKRDALKQAAKDLVDIIYGPNDTGEDLYVAVVPFSARVNVGTSRAEWLSTAKPNNWKGCVEQRTGDEAFNDAPLSVEKFPPSKKVTKYDRHGNPDGTVTPSCPQAEVLPLTASKATVKNKIGSLGADGNTRIDVGAGWGWRTLSERWQGAWKTPGLPLSNDAETAKAIVIMTDGKNEPDSDYETVTSGQADDNLSATCEAMKAEDYVVFTVAFQAPTSVQPLLRDCASSSSHFFNSPTAADLKRAFRQIAGRLSALRLAE